MIWRNRRRSHDHLRAKCLEKTDFFLRHLIRHCENALVSAERCCDREADPRIPARAFDYRPAGFQLPLLLCPLDDRKTDSILHRAARIEEFRLRVNRSADSARDLVQLDKRSPADRLK